MTNFSISFCVTLVIQAHSETRANRFGPERRRTRAARAVCGRRHPGASPPGADSLPGDRPPPAASGFRLVVRAAVSAAALTLASTSSQLVGLPTGVFALATAYASGPAPNGVFLRTSMLGLADAQRRPFPARVSRTRARSHAPLTRTHNPRTSEYALSSARPRRCRDRPAAAAQA
jgi:hypothetical protein